MLRSLTNLCTALMVVGTVLPCAVSPTDRWHIALAMVGTAAALCRLLTGLSANPALRLNGLLRQSDIGMRWLALSRLSTCPRRNPALLAVEDWLAWSLILTSALTLGFNAKSDLLFDLSHILHELAGLWTMLLAMLLGVAAFYTQSDKPPRRRAAGKGNQA